MKKIKKITSSNIQKIVKEHFLDDSNLPEHKIDTIIKEYLRERESFIDDDEPIADEYEFSPKTSDAISDMIEGLGEMIDDLDIIKEKEGNVLVLDDEYADDYLGRTIEDLEKVIDDLKLLINLNNNKNIDL